MPTGSGPEHRRRLVLPADSVGEPEVAILSYIPKRRTAATSRPRDLTLPSGSIAPCLPMTAPAPPSGPLWLHEIKHDGFRIIARKDGLRVKLYSRLGDLTQHFPLIVEAMTRLPSCTIDGEAIVCDDDGVPSYDLLRHRRRDDRVFLYAFDLIELEGKDRRRDALAHRKVDLGRLLADAGPGVVANKWADGSEYDGAKLFAHVCSLGLEGIVSKHKNSRYISGRSPYWRVMKNPQAARREAEANVDREPKDRELRADPD
jgi:bifunctional non-homologous end joining protein LigD